MNWSWSSLPGFKSTKLRRSFDDQGSVGRSWVCLPPARFTTNASESLNAVLKAGVQYRKTELPAFVQKLQKLVVDELEREFERAIIDRGNYQLQAQLLHLQIPELK